MFHIGCDASLSSIVKGRINLVPGAAEPRQRVVSVWISLVSKKLLFQGIAIEKQNKCC